MSRRRSLPALCLILSTLYGCSGADGDTSFRGDLAASAYRSYQRPPGLRDGWSTATPESLGLAAAPLEEMTTRIGGGEYGNVHALLIARNDRLVYEAYFRGSDRRWRSGRKVEIETMFSRDTLHGVRSVTKSVTGAVFGAALASGALDSLDRPILDFFPEHADLATPNRGQITLRHALTMSAGLDWNEGSVAIDGAENHETQMYASDDPARFVLARPLVDPPGGRWRYSGGLTTLLGYVVSRSTGRSFGEVARSVLFEPLGIEHVEWGWAGLAGEGRTGTNAWRDIPELRWTGSEPWSEVASPPVALWLRPRDLLKIGAVYANGGRWNDRQVLPAAWVAESLKEHIELPDSPQEHGGGVRSRRGYGYQWYRDEFQLPYGNLVVNSARGRGGQRIWIVPELDLVVVQLGGGYDDWKAGYQAERLLLERIVPWALSLDADYRHEVPRPVAYVEPGEWPIVKLDRRELGEYVGDYDQAGDTLQIREAGGVLRLSLPVAGSVSLVPEGEHRFAAGEVKNGELYEIFWPAARVVFVRDTTGAVTGYEWRDAASGRTTLRAHRLPP